MDLITEPTFFFTVDEEAAGARLDRFLADRIRECSRTFLQRMIRDGNVSLRGGPAKPSAVVKPGDEISVTVVEEEREYLLVPEPEPIPLEVLWEDADVIVVSKPPGMATHPSYGHTSGTLVNALLHHSPQLSDAGGPIRPGIVHRLDIDTSGVLVVAKTDRAHRELQEQFRRRETRKEYRAICHGCPSPTEGSISLPIDRNPRERKRMRTSREGKASLTDYKVLGRNKHFSYLAVRIHTGRTHQIRVHLKSRGHPVLCDGLYGREVDADESYIRTKRRTSGAEPVISRQMLHAMRLSFRHPSSGVVAGYEAAIPRDFQRALDIIVLG